nr:uncharacterized protein LOC127315910 [Lolium perenne]
MGSVLDAGAVVGRRGTNLGRRWGTERGGGCKREFCMFMGSIRDAPRPTLPTDVPALSSLRPALPPPHAAPATPPCCAPHAPPHGAASSRHPRARAFPWRRELTAPRRPRGRPAPRHRELAPRRPMPSVSSSPRATPPSIGRPDVVQQGRDATSRLD